MVNVTICTSREGNGNACYIMAASPLYHQMFVTIISTSQQKMRKNKNIDYYFCITSMQKIKRFIKDIPFKRVLICKTIQKGSKSWNSSQIWLFFKTYKCKMHLQNSKLLTFLLLHRHSLLFVKPVSIGLAGDTTSIL